MSAFKIPTQIIDLPSKGLPYPKDNPLSSGKIEMKFGTPQQENILANESYRDKGILFDKLFESMIVSKINYDDLIVGDKDAIFFAARVLMFGKNYDLMYLLPGEKEAKQITVDLTTLKDKVFDETAFVGGKNEFDFVLPHTGVTVTYKLLTHKDEKIIEQEVNATKAISPELDKPVSTYWYYHIVAVNGNRETAVIRDFVDNGLITLDSDPLREQISKISPGIDPRFDYKKSTGEVLEGLYLPITARFFSSTSKS